MEATRYFLEQVLRKRPYIKEDMKLHYYKETDSLYIDLTPKTSADSREITPGVVIDYSADGQIVGIDIQHASKIVDLASIEANEIPVKKVSVAT